MSDLQTGWRQVHKGSPHSRPGRFLLLTENEAPHTEPQRGVSEANRRVAAALRVYLKTALRCAKC